MNSSNLLSSLRQHPLILPVYLPTFLVSLAGGILTPVLPLFLRDFGMGYGVVGLVLSGQAIGMLVCDLPGGMILRRLGQRQAMILGFSLFALSTTGLFWARSIPEVFFYRLLSGAGFSVLAVARHSYITDSAMLGVRGRAVALFGGVNRIGSFSGPVIGGLIASAFSLRVPLLFSGALIGLALIVVFFFLPQTPLTTNQVKGSLKSYFRELVVVARNNNRVLATVGVGLLFAQMVRTGRGVIVPLYGADVLGSDVV
jgi:MFS family permease